MDFIPCLLQQDLDRFAATQQGSNYQTECNLHVY
jgi:hypothetical protein